MGTKMRSVEEMREFLADSLEQLLLNCPPEEREYEMREVERLLWEAFWGAEGSPRRDTAGTFAIDVFLNNPGTRPMVEEALNRHPEEDWNPLECDVGPSGFVASLLPSDHHLE